MPTTRLSWTHILRRPAVKVAIGLALIAGVGAALVQGWTDLGKIEWQFQPVPLAAAFLMLLFVEVALAPVWVIVLRALGGAITMRQGVRVYLISDLGKYLPGKVMHALGRVIMLQEYGVATSISVTSIVVTLALSLMGACLVSLLSLPLLQQEQHGVLLLLAVISVPLGLASLHPAVFGRLLRLGARMMRGAKTELTYQPLPYRTTLTALAAYILAWVVMAVALFTTAQALYHIDLAWLPAMAGIAALSYLFGLAVPIAPYGLGAREGLMTLLLATFMPLPAAAAASVLYRFMGILGEALAALVASRLAGARGA